MNWVYKIQKAIDYIECHLDEKINVDEVAKAVVYSPTPTAKINDWGKIFGELSIIFKGRL